MLALEVVVGVMAPGVPEVSALSINRFYTDSDMWLVDPNTHKTSSTIYLYGRADYICLKLKQTDSYNDMFEFKLYSDSKYKNEIESYSTVYNEVGTKYITFPITFDDLKSGTYYAKTYVYKRTSEYPTGVWLPNTYVPREVDESTVRTYKVKIVKKGTDIDEMNTVMYGYENTQKGPKISWYSVPNATGYYVYRRNPDTKKYEKIKTVKDSGKKLTSYTDTSRKNVTSTEYYKVVAYKGSKKTPKSLDSLKVKVLKTPVVSIEAKADNKIKISWNKVASGAKYTLLMKTKDSEWKKLTTTQSRSVVKSMSKYDTNKAYYFTVVAEVDGIKSGYNVSGKAFKYLEYPKLNACTYPKNGGITVNWNTVSGSDQYTVYKKVNNKWTKLAVVDGNKTSYTDTQATSYEGSRYTVRSMSKGVLKSYSDSGIYGIKFEKIHLNEIVENDGELQISWTNPVENQTCNYKVYIKNGNKWKSLANVSGNTYSYSVSNAVKTYEITVSAQKNNVVGPINENSVSYTYYPQMYIPTVIADNKGATISWNDLSGAEGYVIYKKVADGEYEFLAETTENSFLDADIENDIIYSYKVAYKHNGQIVSDKESQEVSKTFIDESVNIVDDVFKSNNNDYYVPIENYESNGGMYYLYKKCDNKWEREYSSVFFLDTGGILVPVLSGAQEFAILKCYSDGRTTRLPENGFIVDFDGCAKDVQISGNKNVVTFSWDAEMFDADKVIIYKNGELLGEALRTEGSLVDNNAKTNEKNCYTIYTQYNNFISTGNVYKEYVYLETPDFSLSSNNNGVLISWDKIPVDCDVVVYRAKANSSDFKRIGSTSTNQSNYTDYNVKTSTKYKYAIRLKDDEGNYTSYNTAGKTIMYLAAPKTTSAKNVKKGVKITWSEVKGAKSYILSYKKDGKWYVLKELPAGTTSYTDTTVKSGVSRYYMLYACNGEYIGAKIYKRAYYVAQPLIKSISATTKKITVKFNSVDGATQYRVYRKTGSDTNWTLIGTTTKTSYADKKVRTGVKYTYSVAGVWERGSSKYVSYKSSSKLAKALATPQLDTISSKKSGIKLSWSIVPGATGYNVYRKNSNGEFEKIAYVKGNESVSYIDKTAKKGKTYTYTVRAMYGSALSGYNKKGLTCKDKY